MSFSEAMGLADTAAFEEMGEDILVAGTKIQAIRIGGELDSRLADGGFSCDRQVRFDVSADDVAQFQIKPGTKIQTVANGRIEYWRVGGTRDNAGTVALMCIGTNGQAGAEF